MTVNLKMHYCTTNMWNVNKKQFVVSPSLPLPFSSSPTLSLYIYQYRFFNSFISELHWKCQSVNTKDLKTCNMNSVNVIFAPKMSLIHKRLSYPKSSSSSALHFSLLNLRYVMFVSYVVVGRFSLCFCAFNFNFPQSYTSVRDFKLPKNDNDCMQQSKMYLMFSSVIILINF